MSWVICEDCGAKLSSRTLDHYAVFPSVLCRPGWRKTATSTVEFEGEHYTKADETALWEIVHRQLPNTSQHNTDEYPLTLALRDVAVHLFVRGVHGDNYSAANVRHQLASLAKRGKLDLEST